MNAKLGAPNLSLSWRRVAFANGVEKGCLRKDSVQALGGEERPGAFGIVLGFRVAVFALSDIMVQLRGLQHVVVLLHPVFPRYAGRSRSPEDWRFGHFVPRSERRALCWESFSLWPPLDRALATSCACRLSSPEGRSVPALGRKSPYPVVRRVFRSVHVGSPVLRTDLAQTEMLRDAS